MFPLIKDRETIKLIVKKHTKTIAKDEDKKRKEEIIEQFIKCKDKCTCHKKNAFDLL